MQCDDGVGAHRARRRGAALGRCGHAVRRRKLGRRIGSINRGRGGDDPSSQRAGASQADHVPVALRRQRGRVSAAQRLTQATFADLPRRPSGRVSRRPRATAALSRILDRTVPVLLRARSTGSTVPVDERRQQNRIRAAKRPRRARPALAPVRAGRYAVTTNVDGRSATHSFARRPRAPRRSLRSRRRRMAAPALVATLVGAGTPAWADAPPTGPTTAAPATVTAPGPRDAPAPPPGAEALERGRKLGKRGTTTSPSLCSPKRSSAVASWRGHSRRLRARRCGAGSARQDRLCNRGLQGGGAPRSCASPSPSIRASAPQRPRTRPAASRARPGLRCYARRFRTGLPRSPRQGARETRRRARGHAGEPLRPFCRRCVRARPERRLGAGSRESGA